MTDDSMEDFKKDMEKMKAVVLSDYQYYDRRFDTVSMVFSGFGLYGCFEMLKWYLTIKYTHALWLFIPIVLWLVILFLSLYNISREKRIREYYLKQVINIPALEDSERKTIIDKNIKLEDRLTKSRDWIFKLTILGVLLMLVSLGCFLMES